MCFRSSATRRCRPSSRVVLGVLADAGVEPSGEAELGERGRELVALAVGDVLLLDGDLAGELGGAERLLEARNLLLQRVDVAHLQVLGRPSALSSSTAPHGIWM